MPKYRKIPVVIEAVPVRDICINYGPNLKLLPSWVNDAYLKGLLVVELSSNGVPTGVTIKTLEGDHFGGIKDMVIQGVAGELYPCKMDIFNKTYELVE